MSNQNPDFKNPYAAPQTTASVQQPQSGPGELPLASQGTRFLNVVIDNVVLYAINFAVGFVLGFLLVFFSQGATSTGDATIVNIIAFIVGYLVAYLYYFLFEASTGYTLGKLITGCRVVNENGGQPTIGQLLGRSAARFIPFEAFSFLGGKGFPVGWHDSLSKTRVIRTR